MKLMWIIIILVAGIWSRNPIVSDSYLFGDKLRNNHISVTTGTAPIMCIVGSIWYTGVSCRSLRARHPGRHYCDHYTCTRPFFTPLASTNLKGGIPVSPCPSVRPSVCPSVDRIVSALYLQQYSPDPFHICTSYYATSEGVPCVEFVTKFQNL